MIPENKIIFGDCISGMRMWPANSVDLVVSDPPYMIQDRLWRPLSRNGMSENGLNFKEGILNSKNYDLIVDYFNEIYRILKNDSAAYIFSFPTKIDFFLECAKSAGFKVKNIIVWEKNKGTFKGDLVAAYVFKWESIIYLNKGRRKINGRRINDIWYFPPTPPNKQIHQHQKPIPLLMQCISKSSNPGDIVFDGFMGSGSTAVAAVNTGRKFVGFELDPDYYKNAVLRVESVQNQYKEKEATEGLVNYGTKKIV